MKERKPFQKYGETFEYLDSNEQTGLYLYQRKNSDGDVTSYEVVKPIYDKRHDIYFYPCAAQFGTNGYFLPKRDLEFARWLLNHGLPKGGDIDRSRIEYLHSI